MKKHIEIAIHKLKKQLTFNQWVVGSNPAEITTQNQAIPYIPTFIAKMIHGSFALKKAHLSSLSPEFGRKIKILREDPHTREIMVQNDADESWGIAKRMTFKSRLEAEFYQKNGRFPDAQ